MLMCTCAPAEPLRVDYQPIVGGIVRHDAESIDEPNASLDRRRKLSIGA